jgi:DNA-binding beta-propeller fold protein YncE
LPDPSNPGALPATGRTFGLGFGHGIQDIESDPSRNRVYLSFRNSIVVLSTDTYLVERVVPIGSSPRGIALSRDGLRLYAALANGGSVAILDTQTFQKTTVEVVIDVGTPFVWDVLEVLRA